jgi:hypothetical protein
MLRILYASQRIAIERRNAGKTFQQTAVRNYPRSMGFGEVQTEVVGGSWPIRLHHDETVRPSDVLEFSVVNSRALGLAPALRELRTVAARCHPQRRSLSRGQSPKSSA